MGKRFVVFFRPLGRIVYMNNNSSVSLRPFSSPLPGLAAHGAVRAADLVLGFHIGNVLIPGESAPVEKAICRL